MATTTVVLPPIHRGTCHDLHNAVQNGTLIVDLRDNAAYSSHHVACSQHISDAPFELPDDKRMAILYSDDEVLDDDVRVSSTISVLHRRLGSSFRGVTLVVCKLEDIVAHYDFLVSGYPNYAPYRPHPQYIVDGVFLGSKLHADDDDVLRTLRIKTVINLAEECRWADSAENPHELTSEVKRIDFLWRDSVTFSILHDLSTVSRAIQDATARGNVLVHCWHGMSRSAAALASWLVRYRGYSVEEACKLLRRQRPIVRINDGFLEQLHEFAGLCKPLT